VKALGPIEVGYCARPGGEVDLRLIHRTKISRVKPAPWREKNWPTRFMPRHRDDGGSRGASRPRRAQTVTTAESCTGGLVASRITNVSHSSEMFRYGW